MAATPTQPLADQIEESFRRRFPDWGTEETCEAFTISTRTGERFVICAPNHSQAALIAGTVLNATVGRGGWVCPARFTVIRTTGIHGLSGWFQGYVALRDGTLNSTGPSFHVM